MYEGLLCQIYCLHVFVSESELQIQSAEQRALKAEEALQAALETIKDLEKRLEDQSSLEPKSSDGIVQITNCINF